MNTDQEEVLICVHPCSSVANSSFQLRSPGRFATLTVDGIPTCLHPTWTAMRRSALALLVLSFPALLLLAATPPSGPAAPKLAPPNPKEVEQARKGIRLPQGFRVDAWAAEPLLANPVVFSIDHQGRVYVAETFRLKAGVGDI